MSNTKKVGYPEISNDKQELYEFSDVMYTVVKFSGCQIVDINEFDSYIFKVNTNNLNDRMGSHFCKILKNLQTRISVEHNLRWYMISKLMAEKGYIYPVPMKNMFTTFSDDVMYQRYYVVVNKTSIYDILFDSTACDAAPDKCSAKVIADKFVLNYKTAPKEKVYLDPNKRIRTPKFDTSKNFSVGKFDILSTKENAKYAKIALLAKYAKYVSNFSSKEQCEKIIQKIDEMWDSNDNINNTKTKCYKKIKKYIENENNFAIHDILNDVKEIEEFTLHFKD